LNTSARQATDTTAVGGTTYVYDILATGDGSTAIDSPPSTALTVVVPTPGVPTTLRWLTQPVNATTNTTMAAMQVEILDAFGMRVTTGSPAVTLTITGTTPTPIPNTQVTFVAVDSQETQGEQADGPRAVDGLTTTFWHTQWFAAQPPYPHWLIVDLRTTWNLTGFRYLPQQDGTGTGTVNTYEFYVSPDGVTWGSPVSSGSFTPGDATEKTKLFSGRTARYVKLQGLSEISGNPFMSVAELTVLQSGTGAASITGTNPVPASAGVATFSTIQLTAAGTYTLDATSPGLTLATSTTFQISDPPPPQGPQVRRVVQ